MELGARQQLFKPRGLDFCVAEAERADGFPKEDGFARFYFDHSKGKVGAGQLQGNCRRPTAGAGIEQGSSILWDVSCGDDRFDYQAVNRRIVAFRCESKSREVDLGVPLREELIVGFKAVDQGGLKRYSR